MDSSIVAEKPHAVCVPFPTQGHITPMLKLALLLHSKGFHITFVNTEYNRRRLLKSRGPSSLDGLPDFRFEAIPDGLPMSEDATMTQDIPSLCKSTMTSCFVPFRDLLRKQNDPSSGVPPVTCIISDSVMNFTLEAADELGVPDVFLWTASVCGLWGYYLFRDLIERGFAPLKDMDQLNDREFMERAIEGLPALDGLRFKDFPSFIRTTDPDDFMLNTCVVGLLRFQKASAVLFNTFEELDRPLLDALTAKMPPLYALGPLNPLSKEIAPRVSVGSDLWKVDNGCLQWLQGKPDASVLYVNFGSITVMTNQQLVEFAWGLANSGQSFLLAIRSDLVRGESAVLPEEFLEETRNRGLITSWCPQEEVLNHPAVGGFLTHCGWNSTLESISAGVPMLCWPFIGEQQTNCRYLCTEWGVGMEIDGDVKRKDVEELVRELMCGERGKTMRARATEWKEGAVAATLAGGSSSVNIDRLINEVLCKGEVEGFAV